MWLRYIAQSYAPKDINHGNHKQYGYMVARPRSREHPLVFIPSVVAYGCLVSKTKEINVIVETRTYQMLTTTGQRLGVRTVIDASSTSSGYKHFFHPSETSDTSDVVMEFIKTWRLIRHD